MPYVQVGDHALSWRRRGAGPPLLLVQGMAGHHALWGEAFLAALAADFDVVTFDHRGIGADRDGPDAVGDFTVADLAADAAAVLDVVGWDDAHVLGISLGGMVAQELALGRPERVRSVVLGCTYAGGAGATLDAPGPLRLLQAMQLAATTGTVENAVRTAYEVNLSPAFRADDTQFAAFAAASLAVRVPMPVVLQQAKAVFGHDTSGRLPGLAAPTLVVHGTADQMIGYANAPVIADLVPRATLRPLDGVGHLLWWEQPGVTAGLVREHCR
ncbi:Pimeloyl-ACP methyl ester carboxylesterase [Jatrophihabitans endophyticus]|uniref:Pimeloyl-ACP methyl ester carboxylesterase n=1 Tax=Jatrophihabitans endophyticus TaxID=1206085 RepID=A0A1M5C6B4_9ACTN|nr:alpha/beta hydrolase [Jatrophihabitans endophyticus]SHF50186.1 Pimeloyl-ACP methyl ester carboxylesterase [Jatrophihabitans endophyticus]